MSEDILKNLGRCMRDARKSRGLTQEELSDKANVSMRHISKIERGIMNPSYEILYALINCLGVSADVLFHPNATVAEKENKQLIGYYSACQPEDRKLVMATVQSLTKELVYRYQSVKDDEQA